MFVKEVPPHIYVFKLLPPLVEKTLPVAHLICLPWRIMVRHWYYVSARCATGKYITCGAPGAPLVNVTGQCATGSRAPRVVW